MDGLEGKLGELPPELRHQVMTEVGGFPISLEEAKKVRDELIDERRALVTDVNGIYEEDTCSFSKH